MCELLQVHDFLVCELLNILIFFQIYEPFQNPQNILKTYDVFQIYDSL